MRLFLSCPPGLEPVLEAEVRSLLGDALSMAGGIEVDAGPEGLARVHVHVRTASRVLVRAGAFRARHWDALLEGTRALDLSPYLSPKRPVRLHVTCKRSKLYHTGAIAERMHGVLFARYATEAAAKIQPDDDSADDAAQGVFVRVDSDQFHVSVDATGVLLHKRGYRQATAKAPLRETLAAAILALAGYRGDEPLWNPLCGSGTIALEAALIATRRAPGAARSFAFEDWPSHKPAALAAVRKAAQDAVLALPQAPLFASDHDAGAITAALSNAERAGLAGCVDFQERAFDAPDWLSSTPKGLAVLNPPWGRRVENDSRGLTELYRSIGAVLAPRTGWRLALLCSDPNMARATGMALTAGPWIPAGGVPVRLWVGSGKARR